MLASFSQTTSEPYWLLDLGVMNKGTMCRAVWDSGRSFNQNKVDALVAKCMDASPPPSAIVVSVVTKEKKQGRPVPLNTVALLKACSKALGIGPHQALGVAERLYLSGYLSYPRTESTKYPKSFDIVGTLQDQTQDNRWGKNEFTSVNLHTLPYQRLHAPNQGRQLVSAPKRSPRLVNTGI